MSKIMSILVPNFQKSSSARSSTPQRDLAKLCIFKLIMAKSNFQKISYDVISVMSSLLRHRKTSPN